MLLFQRKSFRYEKLRKIGIIIRMRMGIRRRVRIRTIKGETKITLRREQEQWNRRHGNARHGI